MFELPINEDANRNNRENRKKVLGIVLDILDKNDVKYKIDIDNRTRYLASIPNLIGEDDLYITTNINDNREICKQCNFKIAKYGALLTHNNLNILKLTVANEIPYEESNTEYDDEYMNTKIDLKTLLDNQDHKRIFLSSDWHFFQTHYKHEANPVNTQKIVAWCKENIKDDDIFMYLGDISFRYANKQDQEESQRLLKSIPGIKVLIIGNHDGMLGQEYFTGCGFDYVFEEFTWNNYIFTHRPINMSLYSDEMLNIHGHIHKWPKYNTTDGKRNINVYPWYFNNKPVTLDYIEHHVEDLVKDHEWNKSYMLGESTIEADELVDTILSNLRTLTKQTKSLEETKRSELPDSAFGIPEDRKYPLDTEQHVRSAIKLFGHAEESKKKELAKRIKRAADKYGIEIPETTQVYKYLHESVFDNELVLSEIMSDINTSLNEAVLKSKQDIKYNIDKFESGEVSLALILGFAGSGKSTLGRNMADGDKIEHIELDDVLANYRFSDNNLKSYNDLIYSFFKGKGSKYRVSNEYLIVNRIPPHKYEVPLMYDFLDYAIQYCKSNKKTKYILDGIWPMSFDIPCSKFDNICVVIKGTSFVTSTYRATKRDKQGSYDGFLSIAIKKFFTNIGGRDINGIKTKTTKIFEKYYKYFSDKVKKEEDKKPIKESYILDEWSMAACNPIVGIHKPFILKIGLDSGSVINTKQYAFSPDIISDKYLVVNEDAHLSIVDKSYLDDKVIESVYEYKGNRLFKLAEAYKNNSIVDNTVFYTALTGKPMLTEDQINFDSNFSKVDISRYEQEVLTDLATNKDAYLETVGRGSEYNAPVLEEAYIDKIPYINTYHRDDIVVKEDFDGYYFYNTITKRRTSSVGTITNLTETMLKTVM